MQQMEGWACPFVRGVDWIKMPMAGNDLSRLHTPPFSEFPVKGLKTARKAAKMAGEGLHGGESLKARKSQPFKLLPECHSQARLTTLRVGPRHL